MALTPLQQFDAEVEKYVASADDRCLCRDTKHRAVCGRRCVNGVRYSRESATKVEALKRRLKAEPDVREDIEAISEAHVHNLAKKYRVKAEFIPSVIDTSDSVRHRKGQIGKTGRPVKYQIQLVSTLGVDELGPVFSNPTTYCDMRKKALKGLVRHVQAQMGFFNDSNGDAAPSLASVKMWKRSLVGFGKPAEWYATVWAPTWCRPLRKIVSADNETANTQLATYVRNFFNEHMPPPPMEHEPIATGKRARTTFFLDDPEDRGIVRQMLRPMETGKVYKKICLMVPS